MCSIWPSDIKWNAEDSQKDSFKYIDQDLMEHTD